MTVDGHFGTWDTIVARKIGGRIDTQSKLTPDDDTEAQLERGKDKDKKPSVLEKLKEKQAENPVKSKSYVFTNKADDDTSFSCGSVTHQLCLAINSND